MPEYRGLMGKGFACTQNLVALLRFVMRRSLAKKSDRLSFA